MKGGASSRLTPASGQMVGALKRTYATTARRIGGILTSMRVLPEEVPPIRHRWKHWAVSLTRVHDSLGIAEMGVPWWTYRAIDEVDSWLRARSGPIRAFEYGSGASTLWLADRVHEVTSIEHHADFAKKIGPVLATRPNVTLLVVEPEASAHPRVGSHKPGNRDLDFAGYVHAIDAFPGVFDLIIIDGRAREACLRLAVPRLAAGGLIVFDNSRRRRYRRAIQASGLRDRRFRGLTPTLPYPDCTSLLDIAAPAAGSPNRTSRPSDTVA